MDYIIKRERPIGPHKKLAPGVRYDGRIGPVENYRYRVNYPEVSAAVHTINDKVDVLRYFYTSGRKIHY